MKQAPDLEAIPIVAFTADTNEADRSKNHLDAGCDGYSVKPDSAQELLQIVQEYPQ